MFAYFIGLLEAHLIEGMMTGVRIMAENGPVDWIWLPEERLWCIDGALAPIGPDRRFP
ncbi:hypothetical protein FDH38_gp005 [Dinoroseobacter phage vB_DshS-R5C]|uniref:Uncharacterized protein n=1 Tax=Dinoroseobacter phage vB_DshS-R5C TaxID=1965368 RepID=A0A1V0DY33_9CAUD|nr:hypothetical protein FDH38_gp005 [Dinoroseobacter phage vB_DshS-R5C]ARB06059.1 hypothetical protein vBDshSR5C_5 [Dinoroseobacter phage vB_DshS-R5C]